MKEKRKLNEQKVLVVIGVAGHRARDPPEPVSNSEVKLRSVPSVSVVFGHAKPGKLAAPVPRDMEGRSLTFITDYEQFF